MYPDPKWPSQWDQDRILDRDYFRGRTMGTFIDVGAWDGVFYSNTFAFERYRGWRGICVEPNPQIFMKLLANRPTSICVKAAASDHNGEAEFLFPASDVVGLLGVLAGKDERSEERLAKAIADVKSTPKKETVQLTTLDKVMSFNMRHIDLLSIDTEGTELDVLAGINLTATTVNVVLVENNYKDRRLFEYLAARGYDHDKTIEQDEIFVRRGWEKPA